MVRFLIRRLLETVPLLFLLSLLIFSLFEWIPGDYLTEMELNPVMPARRLEEMRRLYGLKDPFLVRYSRWLLQVGQGNLGYSFAQQRPALEIIGPRLGNSLRLTLSAFVLTLLLSIPLALWSALYAGRWPDRLLLLLSLGGLSLPTVLAALLLLYFAFWSGWFPIGGTEGLRSLLFPSLTLALPSAAFLMRTLRLQMIEALEQPCILAARARGLPGRRVLYHAFRNAINPVISISGLLLGGLLSGSVVVERVFHWPGLGSLTVASIFERDLFLALNCVLVAALLIVAANLLADLVLAWNDPRVRQP